MNQASTEAPRRSRNVIRGQHVHVVSPANGVPAPHGSDANSPRITLIKDANKVTAIEIVCACGEVIRLDCEY